MNREESEIREERNCESTKKYLSANRQIKSFYLKCSTNEK